MFSMQLLQCSLAEGASSLSRSFQDLSVCWDPHCSASHTRLQTSLTATGVEQQMVPADLLVLISALARLVSDVLVRTLEMKTLGQI